MTAMRWLRAGSNALRLNKRSEPFNAGYEPGRLSESPRNARVQTLIVLPPFNGKQTELGGRHSNECHLLSMFLSGVIHPAPINQLHRKLMNELKREPAQ